MLCFHKLHKASSSNEIGGYCKEPEGFAARAWHRAWFIASPLQRIPCPLSQGPPQFTDSCCTQTSLPPPPLSVTQAY